MDRSGDVGRDVSRALDVSRDMSGSLNPLLLLMNHLWSRGLWVSLWPLCRHPLLLWLLLLEGRHWGRLVLNWNLWRCIPLSLRLGVTLHWNLRSNGAPWLWRRNCTDRGHLHTLLWVHLGHHGCPLLLGHPRWHWTGLNFRVSWHSLRIGAYLLHRCLCRGLWMGVCLGHHSRPQGHPLLLLGRHRLLRVGRTLASRGHLGWHGRLALGFGVTLGHHLWFKRPPRLGLDRGRMGSPGGTRRGLGEVVRGNRMQRLGRNNVLGLCLGLNRGRMRTPGGKRCLSRLLGGHSTLRIGLGGHSTLGVCLGLGLGLGLELGVGLRVRGGHADDPGLDGAAGFGLQGCCCQPPQGRVGLGCCLRRRVGTSWYLLLRMSLSLDLGLELHWCHGGL